MLQVVVLLRICLDLNWKKCGETALSSHTLMHCNVGVLQPSIKKRLKINNEDGISTGWNAILIKLELLGICSVNKDQSLEEGNPSI